MNPDERPIGAWPDPTREMLHDPLFNEIWDVIKTWDINVPEQYVGYCGATGNHARAIFDAITAWNTSATEPTQVKVPGGQTPLNDDLTHRYLDVINEGSAARDSGASSPYHGHSLEHCLHATGWVQRDLRLALDKREAEPARVGGANREAAWKKLREYCTNGLPFYDNQDGWRAIANAVLRAAEPAQVGDVDREAAKSLLGRDDAGPSWWSIDSGNADNDPMVQAFAKHRAQGHAEAAREIVALREAITLLHTYGGTSDYSKGWNEALSKVASLFNDHRKEGA